MNQYWAIALLVSWLICIGAGWEARGWKDGSAQAKVERHHAKALGKGAADIITGNQELDKEIKAHADPCLSTKLPFAIE